MILPHNSNNQKDNNNKDTCHPPAKNVIRVKLKVPTGHGKAKNSLPITIKLHLLYKRKINGNGGRQSLS
jgi:hypothetical protein